MKHTPGPWKAHKKSDIVAYTNWEIHWSDDGECVTDGVYEEADARLIAAAPELLEALKDLLLSADCAWEERNKGHDWTEACEYARMIIGKAEGIQS